MGYLGQAASFTGTQNNKRVSATATAGQVDFLPEGGYSIGAIDVYRNGVKLVGQKDFTALDGVTVTLTQGASENDSLEFVIFENFAVNDVVTTDGDSVIRGNLQVNGDLGIVGGTLSATVAEARNLAVGATAYGINASGVITATSFSGDGSALTGIAATDDVRTSSLVVAGVSTFNGNVELPNNQNLILGDGLDDSGNFKLYNGANEPFEIFGSSKETYIRNTGSNANGININANASVTLGGGGTGTISVQADSDGKAKLYTNAVQKLRTDAAGVIITGVCTATSFAGSGANLTNLPSSGGGLNELEATLFG